jgi:hypothetical protein
MSSFLLRTAVVLTRKPHRCFGCTKLFPRNSILERNVFADCNTIASDYLCQDCSYELDSWQPEDQEVCLRGDVGYWKNGRWFPVNQ